MKVYYLLKNPVKRKVQIFKHPDGKHIIHIIQFKVSNNFRNINSKR